ncbi:Haemolysin-III related [Streptococcus pasteurianus]|nr:Haemolysin-III related [Streptococcus pasteurianus]
MARLIVITSLKNVFSIQEISQTLAILTADNQSQKRYDDFVACMNGEKIDDLPPVVVSACQTLQLYYQTHQLVQELEGEKDEYATMTMKLSKRLSFGEEVANSVTHAVGAVAMLVLLPITAIYSYHHYGIEAAVGMSIFDISLFLMFLSSTIYHSMQYDSPQKFILRIIDHSMIYIAIAGSYTPVALSLVGGWLGYVIIILQWGATVFGILYKIFAKKINERFSLFLYLLMGWLVIFIIPSIVSKTGVAFWLLMLAGGLSYTIGAIFYARKRPYDHMIWHLFILLASVLHYIAIVYYML